MFPYRLRNVHLHWPLRSALNVRKNRKNVNDDAHKDGSFAIKIECAALFYVKGGAAYFFFFFYSARFAFKPRFKRCRVTTVAIFTR